MTSTAEGEPTAQRPLTLWVLRHAKALADPPSGGTDHDRPLALRGRDDAQALGNRLGRAGDQLGLPPTLLPGTVLSSTATRAADTADLVVGELDPRPAVVRRRSLYGADADGLLAEIAGVDDETASLMIVGHNPVLEELVAMLVGPARTRTAHPLGGLATCGVVVLGFPAAAWRAVSPATAAVLGAFAPPY